MLKRIGLSLGFGLLVLLLARGVRDGGVATVVGGTPPGTLERAVAPADPASGGRQPVERGETSPDGVGPERLADPMGPSIAVVGVSGELVPRALVHLEPVGAAPVVLGRTDREGILHDPWAGVDPPSVGRLLARGPDGNCGALDLDPVPARERVVFLRSCSLAGRVTGGAAEVVVVWPSSLSHRLGETGPDELAQHPLVRMPDVQPDGAFCATGLVADESYVVSAAGKGVVGVRQDAPLLGCDAPYVEVPLSGGYVAKIGFYDADGSPAAIGSFSNTRLRIEPSWRALGVNRAPVEAFFAGLDRSHFLRVSNHQRWRFLRAAASEELELAMEYRVDVPGYQEAEVRLVATRVDQPVVENRVTLWPTGEPLGDVFLRVAKPPVYEPLPIEDPWGYDAAFYGVGGTQHYRTQLPARALHAGVRLEGVPCGTYHFELTSVDQNFRFTKNPLQVTTEETVLELDFSATGGIVFDVRRADGRPYRGPLDFFVGETIDGAFYGGHRLFLGPPYVLGGVEPNDYELWVRRPPLAPLSEPIRVRSGEVQRVELVVTE